MSDRDRVLAGVRRAVSHRISHPGAYRGAPGRGELAAFAEAVAAAGGEAHAPLPVARLAAAVAARARGLLAPEGRRVVLTPAVNVRLGEAMRSSWAPGRVEVASPATPPGAYHDVALAVATGGAAVAEDGAVAVLGSEVPERALLFLAEHLFLLVPTDRVHPTLHQAFAALPPSALGAGPLTWIAGPSKTADIEQTLVLGAHGPRTLTVFPFEASAPPGATPAATSG